MISKEVTIQKSEGLHARPATFFIQKANEYKSLITIEHGDSSANAMRKLPLMLWFSWLQAILKNNLNE